MAAHEENDPSTPCNKSVCRGSSVQQKQKAAATSSFLDPSYRYVTSLMNTLTNQVVTLNCMWQFP
jgi:hypothetical protein